MWSRQHNLQNEAYHKYVVLNLYHNTGWQSVCLCVCPRTPPKSLGGLTLFFGETVYHIPEFSINELQSCDLKLFLRTAQSGMWEIGEKSGMWDMRAKKLRMWDIRYPFWAQAISWNNNDKACHWRWILWTRDFLIKLLSNTKIILGRLDHDM